MITFFKEWKFQKDTSDVADYFNSYLNSQGFERIINNQNNWWKARHPYKKYYSNPDKGTRQWFDIAKKVEPNRYLADMEALYSASYYHPSEDQRFIIVGTDPYPWYSYTKPEEMRHHPLETLAHEYAHGKAPFTLVGAASFDKYSAQGEALALNTNTKPGHDSRQSEKHADLWGLKYLLYKEGIYDSRGAKDITIDEVKELRKRYPKLRPFTQMTDEQIVDQLNLVAFNNKLIKRKNNKLLV